MSDTPGVHQMSNGETRVHVSLGVCLMLAWLPSQVTTGRMRTTGPLMQANGNSGRSVMNSASAL